MADFITSDTQISNFMMFPRFLLDAEIPETSKLLYMILLDRARLSQKNEGWTDADGHVFLVFPIADLADMLHKSETTIKTCLRSLVEAGLIERKHQGIGRADHIYVKLPIEDGKLAIPETEICPSGGKKSVSTADRKPSGSNNNRVTTTLSKTESKNPQTAYGTYQNVFLTDAEYADLRHSVSGCDSYIEKLSRYMISSGKRYDSHHGTIRSWASRDGKLSTRTRYECKEDESL